MTKKTLYFGYGSNLWKDQMNKRCPENSLIGVGELKGWKWIINSRGYANIIPSPEHVVYGFIYKLTPQDEIRLDGYEGLGRSYEKEWIRVSLLSESEDSYGEGHIKSVMTYIDKRVEEGRPSEEYTARMNKAIGDGIEEGISQEYFEVHLRPFVPPATV